MDLHYLLGLQGLRESLSGALDVDELVRTNSLRDAHYW